MTAALPPLVFITGASSGIGQALAAAYARQGWRLALVARRVDTVQQWLTEQGLGPERAAVYRADVADADDIVAAANRCLAEQGLPEVVIANAGISVGIDTAERADLEVLQDVVQAELEKRLGFRVPVAAIGGPCIAGELAVRRHTGTVIVSRDAALAEKLAAAFVTDYYHPRAVTDMMGVEVCAAFKNFFAIAVG